MHNQHNQQVLVPANFFGWSVDVKVHNFVRINQCEFLCSHIGEDPKKLIDEVNKIFGVMQVTSNDRVDLASNYLNDVAYVWYIQWKKNIGTYATPILRYGFVRHLWTGYSQESWERQMLKSLWIWDKVTWKSKSVESISSNSLVIVLAWLLILWCEEKVFVWGIQLNKNTV